MLEQLGPRDSHPRLGLSKAVLTIEELIKLTNRLMHRGHYKSRLKAKNWVNLAPASRSLHQTLTTHSLFRGLGL